MKKNKSGASSYFCIFNSCVPSGKQHPSNDAGKSRLSFSFPDSLAAAAGKDRQQQPQPEDQNSESIIDPAASVITRKPEGQHCTVIVGTIFGRRTGHVTFCVQRDAAVLPPFLFELSVPMQSLATEMGSGLLRIALECHRASGNNAGTGGSGSSSSSRNLWKASCNGRDVGYATRRWPTDWDRCVLESMKTMTSGVGVLPPAVVKEGDDQGGRGGEMLYMRATYQRIVGSRDAVSYHLISPGTAGGSPPQELSVFLLRTRGD